MRPPGQPHRLARFVRAVLCLAALVIAVPAALIAVSRTLYQSANPTHGLTAPWHWTANGVRRALTHAIAEDELITTLCRALLTVAWVLVAVIAVTVGIELVHQVRHRQPAPRIAGLGWTQTIARNIAAGLIIIATLTPASPAHARPLPPRATATLTINPNTPRPTRDDTGTPATIAEPEVRWAAHVVRSGESVYSIAEGLAGGDTSAARVRAIAQQILDRNLGTTMPDGQRFTSPGYIETGWQLDLPTTQPAPEPAVPTNGHRLVTVEPGDNLWHLLHVNGNPNPTSADIDAVAATNDGTTTPDGHHVFHATTPDLIHPGQQFDLTPVLHDETPGDTGPAPTTPDTTLPPPVGPPQAATPIGPPETEPALVPTTTVTPTTPVAPTSPAPIQSATATTRAVDDQPTQIAVDPGDQQSGRALLAFGITGTVIAAGAAGELQRRRLHRHATRPPHTQPPPLTDQQRNTANDVAALDTPDPQRLAHEITYLYRHLTPDDRHLAIIQAAQLTPAGGIELVFTRAIAAAAGWEQIAGRALRLNRGHTDEELATITTWPPVAPCLVSLGDHDNISHTLINLEVATHGINLTGDPAMQHALITSLVWELATGPLAERAHIVLVDLDVPGLTSLPRIDHLTADEALRLPAPPAAGPINLAAQRVGEHADAHEPTIIITTNTERLDDWAALAATPGTIVIATDGDLPDALEIHLNDGHLTVPAWKLICTAQQLSPSAAVDLDDLLTAADADPVADPTVPKPDPQNDDTRLPVLVADDVSIDLDGVSAVNGHHAMAMAGGMDGSSAEPELWAVEQPPVVVHLLGDVHVTRHGETVKLTGQQLSALAYLAIYKNVARVELLEAISKDRQAGQDRVRDVLYALRRALGTDAITTAGDRIQTGPTITTDLDLFDTLATRARTHPHHTEHCLTHMLDLATGRPFTYPTRAADHWRWINTDYLTGIWEGRVADTALELARHHLAHGNAVDAHATARRGLYASPLSNPLTSIMVEALLTVGDIGPAERIVQDWERALTNLNLEPDDNTPRTLLERHRRGETVSALGG